MTHSDSAYWAHSAKTPTLDSNSRAGCQSLAVHLEAAARLAGALAATTRPNDYRFAVHARVAGLLHDFGKYSDSFQQMLTTGSGRCRHAIHGAMLSYFGIAEADSKPNLTHVAAAIAAHHAGLPDLRGGGGSLQARFREGRFRSEAAKLLDRALKDVPSLREAIQTELPQLRLTRGHAEWARPDPSPVFLLLECVQFDSLTRRGIASTGDQNSAEHPMRGGRPVE